ncbi:chaperone NapD, partial [Mycobacterium tuberculosis]|nr:chaperone NapD [Mycobacterium tuberculosis]
NGDSVTIIEVDTPPVPVSLGDDEWHIAGVLVQTRPTHIARVSESIESIAGSEIHAASDNGKLVVTLEAPSSRAIAAHLTFIQQI